MVVKYVYDAWGNHKVLNADGSACNDGICVLNPFRYRGYYYDVETGLYYLQTRYYDPVTGRFLNRDSVTYADPSTVHGLNLYAYCRNNPVMYTDPTGEFIVAFFVTMAIAGLVNGTISAVKTAMNGGTFYESFAAFSGDFIMGAAIGGAMALGGIAAIGAKMFATMGLGIAAIGLSFIGGVGSYYVKNSILGNELDIGEALSQGAITALAGFNAFGSGYLMGTVGLYNSLKGSPFIDSMKLAQESGLKGLNYFAYGVLSFLEKMQFPLGYVLF